MTVIEATAAAGTAASEATTETAATEATTETATADTAPAGPTHATESDDAKAPAPDDANAPAAAGPSDENPDPASATAPRDEGADIEEAGDLSHEHLRGLIEALIFASDRPMTAGEIAKTSSAPLKAVKLVLGELKTHYARRGFALQEIAGGWLFRTNVQYAPFVRELTGDRPVKLTRAQVETLAIVAYRQPITRPEIDEIRGVDSGATLKILLERDLLRILGKKDEPGRPLLYGTTTQFLEFFGLRSLKDLPTLREFTELSEDSRKLAEVELGHLVPEAGSAVPVGRSSSSASSTTDASAIDERKATDGDARAGDRDVTSDASTDDGTPTAGAPDEG